VANRYVSVLMNLSDLTRGSYFSDTLCIVWNSTTKFGTIPRGAYF